MKFVNDLFDLPETRSLDKQQIKLATKYLEKFKSSTRKYSSYQFKAARNKALVKGGDVIMVHRDEPELIEQVLADPTVLDTAQFKERQHELCEMNDGMTRQLNLYKSWKGIEGRPLRPKVVIPAIRCGNKWFD